MIIKTDRHIEIPKNYMEDDSYNNPELVLPTYGSSDKRTTNKFRQGLRNVR